MKICPACGARFCSSGWDCPICGEAPLQAGVFPTFGTHELGKREAYNPSFFKELVGLEEYNFWFSSRNRLIIWLLKSHFPIAQNILEIGCGTGFVLSGIRKALPLISVSGCDLYSEGLNYAQARNTSGQFFQMDARQLYFENEFDVVGAFDLLEHLEDDQAALREMNRALRTGGGLLLSVPQHPSLWTEADAAARHVRRYTIPELERKVVRAGFRILDVVSFVSLLLPVLVAARLKNSILRKPYSIQGDLDLPPFLNAALQTIMDVEFQLVRRGLRLPFGGSVLIAARKT